MFPIWTPVQVLNPGLESCGRAGVIASEITKATKAGNADTVEVKLDGDTDNTVFSVTDLRAL